MYTFKKKKTYKKIMRKLIEKEEKKLFIKITLGKFRTLKKGGFAVVFG